jgi:hypothetical protein
VAAARTPPRGRVDRRSSAFLRARRARWRVDHRRPSRQALAADWLRQLRPRTDRSGHFSGRAIAEAIAISLT